MFSLTPSEAVAVTYYVSPSGNDANTCQTISTPCKTFGFVSSISAGSTVLAERGGVWNASVKPRAANITFGSYGTGARPHIIAPSGQYAFFGDYYPGTRISEWEFSSIDRTAGLWSLVFVGGGSYYINDIVVHGSDTEPLFAMRGERGLVENSEFYDSGWAGDQANENTAVSVGGYEGKTIEPDPANVTIFRNNYIHDSQFSAMGSWGTNLLIEGNLVERYDDARAGGFGIKIVGRGFLGQLVLRNNTFLGTAGREWRAIWPDTSPGPNQVTIENNYADGGIHCGFIEATDGVIWRGNTCANFTQIGLRVGGGDPIGYSQNALVEDNIFLGARPIDGWIVVTNGSSATLRNNSFADATPTPTSTVMPTATPTTTPTATPMTPTSTTLPTSTSTTISTTVSTAVNTETSTAINTATSTATVETPRLVVDSITTERRNKSRVDVKVRVVDNQGLTVSAVRVTIQVEGTTATQLTDTQGIATFSITSRSSTVDVTVVNLSKSGYTYP